MAQKLFPLTFEEDFLVLPLDITNFSTHEDSVAKALHRFGKVILRQSTWVLVLYWRVDVVVQFYSWFKFIFLCFKHMIIHYNTPKQKKTKFELRIKLNHNIDMVT